MARTVPVVETVFGMQLADPYRWMEGQDNAELAAWLRAQNDATRQRLAAIPGRDRLLARIRELGLSSTVSRHPISAGGRLFFERTPAGEQLPKLLVRDDQGERVLVDPAQLGAAGQHASLNNFAPSPDGKLVVYNIALGGGEISSLRVLDVDSGRQLPEIIERVWGEFAAAWLPDGKGFFYTQMAAPAPGVDPMLDMSARLHVLGTPVESDRPLLGGALRSSFAVAPSEFPMLFAPPGSSWVVAYVGGAQSEVRVAVAPLAKLDRDGTGKTPWRSVAEYADRVEAALPRGDRLYVLTFKDASNRKLVSVPLNAPELSAARVEIAERPDEMLLRFALARDAAYVMSVREGRARLARFAFRKAPEPVSLPLEGWIDALACDPLRDGAVIDLQSWTQPSAFYAVDARGKVTPTGIATQTGADYAGVVAEEVNATSSDGTLVPLSILRRSDAPLDAARPTLLYGYGAYGSIESPSFESSRQAWLERGGVFAVCHVRGGGEKGYAWQHAGSRELKLNGVRDFEACGDYLVRHGFTSPARLFARGGSMGGILVGRAVTERPELFAAVSIGVGVLNPTRILFAINGENQRAELGDPDTEAGFRSILNMDPYQHVEPGRAYPAALFTVGLNDHRVAPWMTGKMAAKLQAASSSGKPVLVRTDADAGHGVGSGRDQVFAERADVWSFFLSIAGEPEFRAAQPMAATPLPSADELIVGSQRGLEAWNRDGSAVRRISLGPALHPRRLDAEHVLALRPKKPEEQRSLLRGARLERISLRDGTRTTLAQLPEFQCANSAPEDFPEPSTLDIQDPSDFELAGDKRAACIALMDRNINMANVRLKLRVDLKDASVTRWLDVGEPDCKAPPGVLAADAPEGMFCDRENIPPALAAAAPRREFPFSFEQGRLFERGVPKLSVADYDVEQTSPSGRWQLLSGEDEEADYIYRRLLLLDRATGLIYPIPPEAGLWPAPLMAASSGLLPTISAPIEATVQIWGEVDVRWLGDSEASELLVIGEEVVRPGELRFLVDGEILR
ncbi:MAG TPA: prolyl oligopeptidase family serine peptidase [Polyangiales bacterium]|nr:prolyl oligopeptidase family serine peptidase [Polyangiales bacterium]